MVFKIMKLDKITQGVSVIGIISAPQDFMVRTGRGSTKEREKERCMTVEGRQEIVIFKNRRRKMFQERGNN